MVSNKKRARFSDETPFEEQNEAADKRYKSSVYDDAKEYPHMQDTNQSAESAAAIVREMKRIDNSCIERQKQFALKDARRGEKRRQRMAKEEETIRKARRERARATEESVEESKTDSRPEPVDRSYKGKTRKPTIDLGEYGFTPRWIVEPAPPQSQLKPHDDIIVQPPTESLSARNSPSSPKMATLVWRFEPGYKEQWDGLTRKELCEYAYKFLECAMRDPKFRDRFREHILDGSHAHIVEDVEDCLPPLPEPPATNLLGELEFSGPFVPCKKDSFLIQSEPMEARSPALLSADITRYVDLIRRLQGPDGACDLPPLPNGFPTGPIALEDLKNFKGVGQTFDMPGYGLPGVLPQAVPDKMIREHAKTKVTKPRKSLPDTERRQYATKSVAGKHLPKATAQNADDDGSDDDDENPKPESFKFAEAHRRRLEDHDFRDKVMPMRTFRRLRPWAGARISKASINEDDLSRLPRYPSAERAFAPRIGMKASTGPSSNGVTARPTASNGTNTSSGTKSVRRNPRRTARNR